MPKPLLAVVTGRPGSGKSTLAVELATELRCPLVSRDRLKEGALKTLGLDKAADPDLAQRICDLFFSEIELQLRAGVSLVAEAAFQHRVWAPRLEPLFALADVRIVVCQVSPELAWERMTGRARRDPLWSRYNPLPESHRGAEEPYEPPRLSVPTLTVNTTKDYLPPIEEIVAFLR